jgi:hypothetical protein
VKKDLKVDPAKDYLAFLVVGLFDEFLFLIPTIVGVLVRYVPKHKTTIHQE